MRDRTVLLLLGILLLLKLIILEVIDASIYYELPSSNIIVTKCIDI